MQRVFLLFTLFVLSSVATADPFTYQARVSVDGSPANGIFDFRFQLYDTATGGTQLGGTLGFNDLEIADGLLTVELNFSHAFDASDIFLHVEMRDGATVLPYDILAPRQSITATPRALVADKVLNPVWSGSAFTRSFGTGSSRVFINRDTEIAFSEKFGVHGENAGFIGMYVSGPTGSFPYYGLSVDGGEDAMVFYLEATDTIVGKKSGAVAFQIDDTNSLLMTGSVDADNFTYSVPRTRTTSVSGNVFHAGQFDYLVSIGTGGFVSDEPASGAAVAPITLPDGAVVHSMTIYVDDTALGNLSVILSRQSHGSSFFDNVLRVSTAGFSGAGMVLDDNTADFNTIDHSLYHYHLRAFSSGWPGDNTMRISSVVIRYSVPEPD